MVDKNKRQSMRFSDSELKIIKDAFSGNMELLQAIRKVFLQLPLSAVDQAMLLTVKNPEILRIIRKAYLPEIEGDAPFHQVVDLWLTVEIKGKDPKDAYLEMVAREKLIAYLDQQLRVLGGEVVADPIVFAELTKILPKTKADEVYSNMIVRNTVIQHNEMQVAMFDVLAGKKEESVEETKKRLAQNSTK